MSVVCTMYMYISKLHLRSHLCTSSKTVAAPMPCSVVQHVHDLTRLLSAVYVMMF